MGTGGGAERPVATGAHDEQVERAAVIHEAFGGSALERSHLQAQVAVQSATRVLDLATTRYEGGVATYLDVITAQQALLNAERLATQLEGQRLLVSVFLVKALGGDWAREPQPR